jgi:hypothetical protein
MFTIVIAVMVPWVQTHVKAYEILQFKYVQVLHINKKRFMDT